MKLETSSWAQVQEYFERQDMVVVPVGSTENHGSQLGLGTDFLIPGKLIELLQSRSDVLCAPVMPFGMADHHTPFPGTLTIGQDGLHLVLSRITEQLYGYGARKFVFLNGHGGNTPVLTRIAVEMSKKQAYCAVFDWWVIAGKIREQWRGGHGAGQETAAMMYACPEGVHMDYAREFHPKDLTPELTFAGGSNVLCDGIPVPVPRTTEQFSEAGWYGPDDIKTATPQWGEEMLTATADFLADFIEKFKKA